MKTHAQEKQRQRHLEYVVQLVSCSWLRTVGFLFGQYDKMKSHEVKFEHRWAQSVRPLRLTTELWSAINNKSIKPYVCTCHRNSLLLWLVRHLEGCTLQYCDQCSTLMLAPVYTPLQLFCDPIRYYLMPYIMTEWYKSQPYSSLLMYLLNLLLSLPSDLSEAALIFPLT